MPATLPTLISSKRSSHHDLAFTPRTVSANKKADYKHPFGNKSEIQRKWHGIVDTLESFYKSRVRDLRNKVDQSVPKVMKDGDHNMLQDVIALETRIIDEQLRMHINMNQEKLISDLTARLALKDSDLVKCENNLNRYSKDFDHIKRKYQRLKKKQQHPSDQQHSDLK